MTAGDDQTRVELDAQGALFDLPREALAEGAPTVRPIHRALWTRNKAALVREYLYLFVQVTHHGTYIDGFAGPQELEESETSNSWAAKLVLGIEQLRHFHLFERNRDGIDSLNALCASQTAEEGRTIRVWSGDMNVRIPELLAAGAIAPKEATFCLLDQRTFECHWSTVQALAQHKPLGDYKIEIFYFLANRWMDRAITEQEDPGPPTAWWGRTDWRSLRGLRPKERADLFVQRFKGELGYRHVLAWPILAQGSRGPVMFHMIHATDHPAAVDFMSRAYEAAVYPVGEQQTFGWKIPPKAT
jgi:three-Cys-motif partner protein